MRLWGCGAVADGDDEADELRDEVAQLTNGFAVPPLLLLLLLLLLLDEVVDALPSCRWWLWLMLLLLLMLLLEVEEVELVEEELPEVCWLHVAWRAARMAAEVRLGAWGRCGVGGGR